MKKLLLLSFVLISYTVTAQIGINATGARPDASAMLDVTASDKGVLIPRMTAAQKFAIVSPKEGLLVYDIDAKQFSYCLTPLGTTVTMNCNWVNFGNASSWVQTGNDLINANSGNVGIGTNTPYAKLDVTTASINDGVNVTQNGTGVAGRFISNAGAAGYFSSTSGNAIVTGTGNVGIGILNPTQKLEVNGTSIIANNSTIDPDNTYNKVMAGTIADGSGWSSLGVAAKTANPGQVWAIGGINGDLSIAAGNGISDNSLQTGIILNTQRNLLLTPFGGNVGIGANTPKVKLDIGSNNTTNAIFGSTSTGISIQQNWPTIGFNQYRDAANIQRYIGNGYAMGNFMDPTTGSMAWNAIPSGTSDSQTSSETTIMTLTNSGNLGIGTSPLTKLHIKYLQPGYGAGSGITPYGIAGFESNIDAFINLMCPSAYQSGVLFGSPLSSTRGGIIYTNNNGGSGESLALRTGGNLNRLVIDKNGNVAIGDFMPTYKLEVNGTTRSKEVIVEAANWPDYVFEDDYQIKSIDELENFIKENKHLPNIPSASEMNKNGLKVGEINKVMMEKIEELALYIIQLKKEINSLKTKNR